MSQTRVCENCDMSKDSYDFPSNLKIKICKACSKRLQTEKISQSDKPVETSSFAPKKPVKFEEPVKKTTKPSPKTSPKSKEDEDESEEVSKDDLRLSFETLMKGRGTKTEIFNFIRMLMDYYA